VRRLNEAPALSLSLGPQRDHGAAWGGLHDFNDDEHTTREEAVLVLKRARAHLEGAPCQHVGSGAPNLKAQMPERV
jgi:hypothetical protein